MTAFVYFRTDEGRFAVPVEATRVVRLPTGLVTVPEQRNDIAGVLPGEPPLTVLTVLGRGGDHVLVLETARGRFGLQVREVLGVKRVADDALLPAPEGQNDGLFTNTVVDDGSLVFIIDPDRLAARL